MPHTVQSGIYCATKLLLFKQTASDSGDPPPECLRIIYIIVVAVYFAENAFACMQF